MSECLTVGHESSREKGSKVCSPVLIMLPGCLIEPLTVDGTFNLYTIFLRASVRVSAEPVGVDSKEGGPSGLRRVSTFGV